MAFTSKWILLAVAFVSSALFRDNHVSAWVPPFAPSRSFSIKKKTFDLRATTVGPRIASGSRFRRDHFIRNETSVPQARFDRSASQQRHADRPCVLTIDGIQYNVTAWGK